MVTGEFYFIRLYFNQLHFIVSGKVICLAVDSAGATDVIQW